MSVTNSAAVDEALVAILSNDPTIEALLPDGVYMDVSPAGKTRCVIVRLETHEDTRGLGMPLYERFVYLVKAVTLATSGVDADSAAFRIHELLEAATLAPITGYVHMSTLRLERVRYPEPDAMDADKRWQHSGGHYEILVSPI
jgi:hypothetical protein